MLPAHNHAALHALFHDACVESDQRIAAAKLDTSEARKPENAHRNRYTNVLPWDSTRVVINGAGSGYINASHVRNGAAHFIATQGPLPSTCEDFFVMLQQHAVHLVVALGPEIEMGRAKFYPYWSHEGVTITSQRQWEGCAITERTCSVVAGGQQHEFVHLHAYDWPDHGVPQVRLCHVGLLCSVIESESAYFALNALSSPYRIPRPSSALSAQ
jgi:protein tyrosine phosphatase